MPLTDFMYYPDFACQIAGMRIYNWLDGNEVKRFSELSLPQRIWFMFGALNLIYQNFGMIIFLWLPQEHPQELYVAQLSETGSVFGLTFVAACNMWMLLYYRQDIEEMLTDLEELYPKTNIKYYRIAHYKQRSAYLMKYTSIFFISAYFYYNGLPIIQLIYELSSSGRQVKFKCQSNTWYPWSNGSFKMLTFVVAYSNQAISSWVGVGSIMASLFLLCFFTTQMQLHFDALSHRLRTLDARHQRAHVELRSLIIYHNRLLTLKRSINRIFNFTFFNNFITSTVAICLMGFAMIMIDLAAAFKYSVGMLSFLVFTLFICYNGTQLTTSSEKLLPSAFYNNWYDGDLKYRKMLLFFMMRSSESQILRAYNFTPVSIATYMTILKFSYQLFTFFRTMI